MVAREAEERVRILLKLFTMTVKDKARITVYESSDGDIVLGGLGWYERFEWEKKEEVAETPPREGEGWKEMSDVENNPSLTVTGELIDGHSWAFVKPYKIEELTLGELSFLTLRMFHELTGIWERQLKYCEEALEKGEVE